MQALSIVLVAAVLAAVLYAVARRELEARRAVRDELDRRGLSDYSIEWTVFWQSPAARLSDVSFPPITRYRYFRVCLADGRTLSAKVYSVGWSVRRVEVVG